MFACTVRHVEAFVDVDGSFVANDKNVYTINGADDLNFLTGILNSEPASYFARCSFRVKSGGFFVVEAQFLEPLPVPKADNNERGAVSDGTERLQALYTCRRDLLAALAERTAQLDTHRPKPERWLFPTLRDADDRLDEAPRGLDGRAAKAWAKAARDDELEGLLDALTTALRRSDDLGATFEDGALRFEVGGTPLIGPLFASEDEGAFVLAQWKVIAATFSVKPKTKGKKLADVLRKVGVTDNAALRDQIIQRQQELSALDVEIAETEASLNQIVYRLYGLTPEQIALVEAG